MSTTDLIVLTDGLVVWLRVRVRHALLHPALAAGWLAAWSPTRMMWCESAAENDRLAHLHAINTECYIRTSMSRRFPLLVCVSFPPPMIDWPLITQGNVAAIARALQLSGVVGSCRCETVVVYVAHGVATLRLRPQLHTLCNDYAVYTVKLCSNTNICSCHKT